MMHEENVNPAEEPVNTGENNNTETETVPNEAAENPSSSENSTDNPAEQPAQEDWKNKFYYLAADFENYKRNQAKERRDLLATAAQGVIKDLLPILDNFERAIKANETLEDIEAIKQGFQLIYQGLSNNLDKHGLKPIESNGQVFNSDVHEAIAQIPAPSEDMKGKVLDTVEKGYSLNEKVIRYAKVAVGA